MSVRGLPYLAAVALAGLFLLAATAKWRDPAATARGFRALGVPRPWTAARAVPAVEALLALGLLVRPVLAGPAALALLVAFTVFLALRIRAGVTAACQCFGGRSDASLSWAEVLRNGWLVVAAAVASGGGGPAAPSPAALVAAALWGAVAWASVRALRRRLGVVAIPH